MEEVWRKLRGIMKKKVGMNLSHWLRLEGLYLLEAYRRIKLGEYVEERARLGDWVNYLTLKDISMVLKGLYASRPISSEDFYAGREGRRVSARYEIVDKFGNIGGVGTIWRPFTLYYFYDSLAEESLEEKKKLLRRLMDIGDKCWRIAEDLLYEACLSVFGIGGVERSEYESEGADVIVRREVGERRGWLFEISIRSEVPIAGEYIEAKKKWRSENGLDDYDLIIIGNAFEEAIWNFYRRAEEERFARRGYIRVHKLRLGGAFPLFEEFWDAERDFWKVRRRAVKISKEKFKRMLVAILERYRGGFG